MARVLFSEVRGVLNDVNDKLSGEDGSYWLEKLKLFLRGEMTPSFKVWKTITLGLQTSSAAYRDELLNSGFRIGRLVYEILNGTTVSSIPIEVDLVVVSGYTLGFRKAVHRDALYSRARKMGLDPCPAEVGPALRLAYKDQPLEECVQIAMEPLFGPDGLSLDVFEVGRNGRGPWLSTVCSGSNDVWMPDRLWVFLRRK